MRRRLLVSAWIACVLVTLSLAAMWIRNYFARDKLSWLSAVDDTEYSEWTSWGVSTGGGQLRFSYGWRVETGRMSSANRFTPGFKHEATTPFPAYMHIDGPRPDVDVGGFVFDHIQYDRPSLFEDGRSRGRRLMIVVPLWALILVGSVVSIVPSSVRCVVVVVR